MDFRQQHGSSCHPGSQPIVRQNAPATVSHPSDKEFHLEMMTQPSQSIATEWTDEKKPRSHKKRKATEWPLEPPPVIALRTANGLELEHHNALPACPNVFCVATLTNAEGHPVSSEIMRGRHSSSLIKLDKGKTPKLQTDVPAIGVFLFDQIHIRFPGEYCLLFTLFEMQMHGDQGMHAVVHNLVRSNPFTVLPQPRRLPKPGPPAEILLALAAQGAKIKIRKPNEDRIKRKPDWSVDANEHDLANHVQMMQPPAHNHLTSIPISMPTSMPTTSMPASMPQSAFMQPPMSMASHSFQMSIPAHANYPILMPTSMPQDVNFGPYQDPNQPFFFGGPVPPSAYGSGFGNF